MKLSRLVYLCIKNVNYYDDDSFTYDYFMTSNAREKTNYSDYSVAINNVFTPLNEAIQRLSDLDKIPYKVVEISFNKIIDNTINLNEISDANIKEVISVANSQYERIPFAPYGVNKIRLLRNPSYAKGILFAENNSSSDELIIEYKEEIPLFDDDVLSYDGEENLEEFDFNNEENNVLLPYDKELSEYGINNAMCQYIIEYVQGKLEEQIAPELAVMHITRAEQYFNNLRPNTSSFTQEKIHNKHQIM